MDPIFSSNTQTVFAWLDFEMTGLDPEHDKIVEIATVLTDAHLEFIAEGPSMVIHQPEHVLRDMVDVVKNMHQTSGLLDEIRESSWTVEDAQRYTIDFLHEHMQENTIFQLAGNSVYQDRAFMRNYMPELDKRFHYRLIDVSTVKSLVRYWYPMSEYVKMEKQEQHRALDDVYESIEELRHYRKHFFV